MVGRLAVQWIGDSTIHCRPFFLLIGNSGKARKGTSEHLVRRVFDQVDKTLAADKYDHPKLKIHSGGLSSGEGIAYAIRDQPDDPNSKDQGVTDKRLLVNEPEFANVLAQCKRENSILSPTIRNLFDGKTLAPLTKTNRIQATDPHVVIVGHITQYELNLKTGSLEAANGFLNRFLICSVERDHLVALPGKTPDEKIAELSQEVLSILNFIEGQATQMGGQFEVNFSDEAAAYWVKIYPTLTAEQIGFVGSLLARMEMYARMLAMIICLLDKKTIIEVNISRLHFLG